MLNNQIERIGLDEQQDQRVDEDRLDWRLGKVEDKFQVLFDEQIEAGLEVCAEMAVVSVQR